MPTSRTTEGNACLIEPQRQHQQTIGYYCKHFKLKVFIFIKALIQNHNQQVQVYGLMQTVAPTHSRFMYKTTQHVVKKLVRKSVNLGSKQDKQLLK